MTRGYDSGGQPGASGPRWTNERTKPKAKAAKVGELGTVAQCIGGDVVDISGRGDWHRCSIAWIWDDGSAMVRLGERATADALKPVPGRVPCRFVRLRP